MSRHMVNGVVVIKGLSRKKGEPMYWVGDSIFHVEMLQKDVNYSMKIAVRVYKQALQRKVEESMVRIHGFNHDAPCFHPVELSKVEHRHRNAKAKGGKHFD